MSIMTVAERLFLSFRLATLVDQLERDVYIARVHAQSLNGTLRNIEARDDTLPPSPVLGFVTLPTYVPLARRNFMEDLLTGSDVVDGRHKIG